MGNWKMATLARGIVFLFAFLQFGTVIGQVKPGVDRAPMDDLGIRKVGEDWPSFLGPNGDGKSNERGILKDWANGRLRVVWKTAIGEGYGMGVVAKGRYFHFGKENGRATLRCLESETGKPIWEFGYESDYKDLYGYDSGPRASPVVDQGRVFIYGVGGLIHCLDSANGKLIWKLDANKRFGVVQNFFGVASTPLIVDGLLFVMVGGSPEESQRVAPGALDEVKPNGTGLIAINKETGEVEFEVIDELASYVSLKHANINGESLILAWMRGSLMGVRSKNGETAFEFPWRSRTLESVNASMPVVFGDEVLISECYGLGSARLTITSDGPQVDWSDGGKREKSMEAHWNTPIKLGDAVFGCSGRHMATAELRCVDWNTGKINWSKRGLSRTSLTAIDGHLIVLGERGQLMLIEATTSEFKLVTQYKPGDDGVDFVAPCWAAPIVSHGLLYVRGKNQLVCFELIPK